MLKTISTSLRKEDFTTIGVTPCHFVTDPEGCDQASQALRRSGILPVTRRFQPDPAALDELVEALYRLVVDVSIDEPTSMPAPPGIKLLLSRTRVRNVS